MNDLEKKKIEINRLYSKYLSNAEIRDCFYHKKEECVKKIKSAHSIQRNGRLSLLE